MILALRRYALALLAPLLTAAQSGAAVLPAPHAGATCTVGPYRLGAIGMPLPTAGGREGDRPGAHGNEIAQIFGIFYYETPRNPLTLRFGGWLVQSFDGRYNYAPAERNESSTAAGHALSVAPPTAPTSLPLHNWIMQLEARGSGAVTPANPSANASTVVAPCFSKAWDGKA
jgi:hypothetical protein